MRELEPNVRHWMVSRAAHLLAQTFLESERPDISGGIHNPDGLDVNSGVFTLPLISASVVSPESGIATGEAHRAFLVGPENTLLRGLLDCVSAAPPTYNPIVLVGPSASGKTHVLHGLVNRVRMLFPDYRAWYLTGADFARQCARAIELDNLGELREKCFSNRLFIVDGLEELAGKASALHELLYILEHASGRDSQLMFACRRPLHEWSWMTAALRSRLEGGLILPVALPEITTRSAMIDQIVAGLAELRPDGVTVPDTARNRLCERNKSYVELRGAVLQCLAGETSGRDRRSRKSASRLRCDEIRSIVKTVARNFELRAADLIGPSRRKSVVQARGVAIYLARMHFGASFDELGKVFGDRDRTTVLHAFQKLSKVVANDIVLKQLVDKIAINLPGSGSVPLPLLDEIPALLDEMPASDGSAIDRRASNFEI